MNIGRKVFILVFIVVVGFLYNHNYFNTFPSAVHAWAQADRYALALGFVDNNLNFFKPQTLIYNHQFPNNWNKDREFRITAVDFPMHDYIPATVMKLTGSTSPLIFRLYIFLFSLAGLYFLFRLSYLLTLSFYKSFLVLVFAATSPVFVYYQAGFLPSVPCLASVIIGLFFYVKYRDLKLPKYLWVSLLFFTLAALSRKTCVIPLFAIIGVEALMLWRSGEKLQLRHSLFVFSLLLILAYQFYNSWLMRHFGSDFLNYLLPPKNLNHALDLVKLTLQHWGFQYFTGYHYLILGALFLAGLFSYKRLKPDHTQRWVIACTGILVAGCSLFCIAMLRQFPDHDYYFLDTFFLPVLLFLILLLAVIPEPSGNTLKYFSRFLGLLAMGFMLYQPVKSQKTRYSRVVWNKTHATAENFRDASAFFDSAGISRNSKILVIDAVAPNLPFIMMQRTGFAVMDPTPGNIAKALKWKYNYIVLQDDYLFNELYYTSPELAKQLNRVAGNGKISVFRLSAHGNQEPLKIIEEGLGQPDMVFFNDFEGIMAAGWTNNKSTTSLAVSGSKAGFLSREDEFGVTLKVNNLPVLKKNDATVLVSTKILKTVGDGCVLVLKVNSFGEHLFYRELNLMEMPFAKNQWQTVKLMFKVPKTQAKDYEFSVYFWNPLRAEVYYDDLRVEVY